MVPVVYTDEFREWWDGLTEAQQDDVARVIGVLEDRGVALGFPLSSALHGASIALRELRVQSDGRPLRVFYVFDPGRQAVVLIGGDKTGRDRFYEEMIPHAQRIYSEYLKETGQARKE